MKASKIGTIRPGDKVTVCAYKGATVYEVVEVGDRMLIEVREKAGYRSQLIDICQVVKHIKGG